MDALDTLAVIGNYSEFRRVASLLIQTMDFDRDINVSVFETNIRGEYKGPFTLLTASRFQMSAAGIIQCYYFCVDTVFIHLNLIFVSAAALVFQPS